MESKFAAKVAQLDEYDNTIYYIGNIGSFGLCPSDTALLENRLTVLKPGRINEETMPVPWEEVDHNYYDKDGKLVKTVPGRIYSKHMVIVIDSSVTLSDSEWEVIRQCAVDNMVPVLVFGKTNILKFQDTLLLKVYYGDEIQSYAWINCTKTINQPIDFELGGADNVAGADADATQAGRGAGANGANGKAGKVSGSSESAAERKEYSTLSVLERDIKFIDFMLDLFKK
ncbi:MAG: hypothetical protein MJ153_08340 [Clostridia bacterium]|nr:hypothetical protein [Clostridia bacterium]